MQLTLHFGIHWKFFSDRFSTTPSSEPAKKKYGAECRTVQKNIFLPKYLETNYFRPNIPLFSFPFWVITYYPCLSIWNKKKMFFKKLSACKLWLKPQEMGCMVKSQSKVASKQLQSGKVVPAGKNIERLLAKLCQSVFQAAKNLCCNIIPQWCLKGLNRYRSKESVLLELLHFVMRSLLMYGRLWETALADQNSSVTMLNWNWFDLKITGLRDVPLSFRSSIWKVLFWTSCIDKLPNLSWKASLDTPEWALQVYKPKALSKIVWWPNA